MARVDEHIARVNAANARIASLYVAWAKAHGVPYNRFLVLYALLEGGPQTQRRIVGRTHLIKQTVSNLVAALVREDLVETYVGEDDHREKVVALTDGGDAYAHDLVDGLLHREREAVERMGEERVALLAQLSEEFEAAIEAAMTSGEQATRGMVGL